MGYRSPPMCNRAYELKEARKGLGKHILAPATSPLPKSSSSTGSRPNPTGPPKSPLNPPQNTSGDDICIPIMKLRDLVLGLASDMENLTSRLAKVENPSSKSPNASPYQNQATQTETDSSLHPPACLEATQIWEQYQTSKKSETQLLVEALKSLDLKSVLEQQNRQFVQQGNLLNNLNRSFSQFSKSGPKTQSAPKPTNNDRNEQGKVRNGSRAKRAKPE